jgi:hypothetical protein
MKEIENKKISLNIDELEQLIEEVYNQDLIYQILVYDVEIYKQMANISFNVMLPLRKTNKIRNEQMLAIGSVVKIGWHKCQRLIVPGGNHYSCMVNLFNILQYKFERPLIKLKNPLNEKREMPSSRQLNLMYEADENSIEYKEGESLLNYYKKNKR